MLEVADKVASGADMWAFHGTVALVAGGLALSSRSVAVVIVVVSATWLGLAAFGALGWLGGDLLRSDVVRELGRIHYVHEVASAALPLAASCIALALRWPGLQPVPTGLGGTVADLAAQRGDPGGGGLVGRRAATATPPAAAG